jgi:hydrogenase maturation protease
LADQQAVADLCKGLFLMKTLIVGLGNPILTDDGIGVHIANEVKCKLSTHSVSDITIREASVGGLRLMEMMEGYEKVILIDAIARNNGDKSGKIIRMDLNDLQKISPTQHSASAHDTSLVTALDAGRLLGMDLPSEVIIFAIEVENVMDFSETPTPAVSAAIPIVTQAVLDEIFRRPA